MQNKFIQLLKALWRRIVAGLTGLLMLIVPGGDRTVVRYMLRGFGGVVAGAVLLSLLLLIPWTGSGAMVSLNGLILLLVVLGGFSLLVGWLLGILRPRDCPDCARPMGTPTFSGHGVIPDYGCDDCDKDFTVRDLASRHPDERRQEARRLLSKYRHGSSRA